MCHGVRPKRPHHLPNAKKAQHGTRQAVTQFNPCFDLLGAGNHLAVAGRPMLAASRPRPRRPHIRPPHDDEDGVGEDEPTVIEKACVYFGHLALVIGHLFTQVTGTSKVPVT